ncbi:anti-sigma factor [Cellulomonas sp. Leaf334]|uniref:anti-sigma factor n=1 Tax=Cellulomonas sp. Leaf334 TaxID=1736339 RepID=UPI0006FA361E|nr:anti-sigma factor [Cellulomonas sp. Leaf334]KQR17584.1 anti-sigma factor [Cellulomonas sp. Leaf334]
MPFDESHVDDDLLALLALGETAGTTADLAHVEECERCADELASLTDVVGLARSGGADIALVAPAPQVWDRVAAELGLAGAAGSPVASPAPVTPALSSEDGVAPVVSLDSRRPRAGRWIAAAAAVGLVLGGGATWWVANRPDPVTVIASAVLEPLPGWDATGSAVVETLSDGSRVLVVDLDQSESSEDGFREVWLLKPDVSGLVSVGTLAGASGRFDLPAGLDLDQFSVVDVSEEQFDGDPAHSGDSIVRGPLEA